MIQCSEFQESVSVKKRRDVSDEVQGLRFTVQKLSVERCEKA